MPKRPIDNLLCSSLNNDQTEKERKDKEEMKNGQGQLSVVSCSSCA